MILKVIQSARNLTGHAGLVAVGHCLHQFAQPRQAIDPILAVRAGIGNTEIVAAYVGLLAMGKSDFDAIENHRGDDFFARALGLRAVPSAATLRQRLDEQGVALQAITDELPVPLLRRARAPISALPMGHVALDLDVFCMDNSGTRKEGVSRTYAGYDGYAPVAAYLGAEGWGLGLELREGKQPQRQGDPLPAGAGVAARCGADPGTATGAHGLGFRQPLSDRRSVERQRPAGGERRPAD